MPKKKTRKIVSVFRILLLFSVLANIAVIIYFLLINKDSDIDVISLYSKNFEYAFFALVSLALTFGPGIVKKRQIIYIPYTLEIVIIVFIYAGIFLSVRYNLYYTFWWWDNLLHFFSGIIIGFIGVIVIYKINSKFSMAISPLLVAFFSFTFAVTMGVFWEILEFTGDVIMGTAHQKWNLPDDAVLLGKIYQGSGLRDTMSDLILNCIGAFITSIIAYQMCKKESFQNKIKDIVDKNNSRKIL